MGQNPLTERLANYFKEGRRLDRVEWIRPAHPEGAVFHFDDGYTERLDFECDSQTAKKWIKDAKRLWNRYWELLEVEPNWE